MGGGGRVLLGVVHGLAEGESMDTSVANRQLGGGVEVSGVRVLNDWGGALNLDDVLSPDWVGVWDGVWLGHVDWGGHLDNVLDVLGHVVWHGVWLLDMDGLLDDVGLLLDGHDGRVGLDGALEGGWHGNGDVGNGGLDDFSVVAGNVSLLAEVHLLPDLLWGLGDGDGVCSLDLAGGVWSGHADGSWCWSGQDWGVGVSTGQQWAGGVGTGNEASWGSTEDWGSNGQLSWSSGGSGDDSREDSGHWVHDEECLSFLSEDKGVCN